MFWLRFLAQFTPWISEALEPPALAAWVKRFITIERIGGGTVSVEEIFREGDEDDEVLKKKYRLKVAPVHDFTPAQHALASPDPFERQNALYTFIVLSKNPVNAETILELLQNEIEQTIPESLHELTTIGDFLLSSLSLSDPNETPYWGVSTEGFHAQILFVIHHIAHTFHESIEPEELRIFQKVLDLLEDIMHTSDDPTLRIIAANLIKNLIYIGPLGPGYYDLQRSAGRSYPPIPLSPDVILAKWGDPESHIQHLVDILTNPHDPPFLRKVIISIFDIAITQKEGILHFRLIDAWGTKEITQLLHHFLNFLWEDSESRDWDKEQWSTLSSPLYRALRKVLKYRHILWPEDYSHLLKLLREVLAYPILPASLIKRPRPRWVLLKEAFAQFLEYEYEFRPDETITFLLDLVSSPADITLLKNTQDWAQRKDLGELWEQCIIQASEKL